VLGIQAQRLVIVAKRLLEVAHLAIGAPERGSPDSAVGESFGPPQDQGMPPTSSSAPISRSPSSGLG
jgi:hypothetical protein